jgi:beta-lactamase regulating signal transducer with metallopeptidase domain
MDAVLNWLWQGSAVAVAWFVMLVALKRARASLRYLVSWAALLFVAALPALPQLPLTATSPEAIGAPQGDAILSLPDTWWTSTLVLLAAWIVWTSIHTVRFLSAIVAIRRARARSRAFPPHVESELPHWCRVRPGGRRAMLVLSDSVRTAAVLGWGTPMIAVAPSLVRTLDANELDRVLIHEWAHVQRRDDVGNILQIVVRIAAGWHPALWWIDRRLHVEREMACDEMAIAITGSPRSYAECLLKLASLGQFQRGLQIAPAVFTPSDLRARVVKIMAPHSTAMTPMWSRSIAATIISTLCVMSVALGGLTLVEATPIVLPFVSPRMITTTGESTRHTGAIDRIVQITTPTLSSEIESARPRRRTVGQASSAQRPPAEQASPSPQPKPEPVASPTSEIEKPEDATHNAGPADSTVAAEAAAVSHPPPARADATTPQPESLWTSAAAGGTAIGRKSKDAGVATAGFFTRFARRVAGSF